MIGVAMLHIKEEDIDRLTVVLHNVLGGQLPTQIELPSSYGDLSEDREKTRLV